MKTTSKALYKYELASQYGMTLNTFSAWLKKIPGLPEIGYYPRLKLLTPKMIERIKDHLGEPSLDNGSD
jgi:hypothetical protein